MVVASAPARSVRTSVRILVPLAALALAFTLPMPSDANHVQTTTTGAPFTAQFVHGGDNAWWVEVEIKPGGDGVMNMVHTQVEGSSTLYPMKSVANDYARQQQGWLKFAPEQAFNVPAGKRVMFWAGFTGSGAADTVLSCWFTHPAGVEQCDGGTSSSSTSTSGTSSSSSTTTSASSTTTTSSPPPFDATFTGVRGNEWWVQAQVATNGPSIAKVDVHLYANGAWGSWMPVARQSWGWGSSYHIVQGTVVQLRATATDGRTDLSSCRQWIPAPNTDAAIVACPGTVAPFDATFTGVKGNEWWVQANVAGNRPIAGVSVRVECTPYWTPLTKQSWGGWTASFHIPANSRLDFQAHTADWASDGSGGYGWTAAGPIDPCPQGNWPRQGSYAKYHLSSGVCGGGECYHSSAVMDMRYREGRWVNTCTITDTHSLPDGGSQVTTRTSDNSGLVPPYLPPRTQAGAQVRPDAFHTYYGGGGCSQSWTYESLAVQGQTDYQSALRDANGQPVTLRAWNARGPGEGGANIEESHWDVDTGMVLDVSSNPRMSGQGSEWMALSETDAGLR